MSLYAQQRDVVTGTITSANGEPFVRASVVADVVLRNHYDPSGIHLPLFSPKSVEDVLGCAFLFRQFYCQRLQCILYIKPKGYGRESP